MLGIVGVRIVVLEHTNRMSVLLVGIARYVWGYSYDCLGSAQETIAEDG